MSGIEMCKPASLSSSEENLYSLACSSNGVVPKMDLEASCSISSYQNGTEHAQIKSEETFGQQETSQTVMLCDSGIQEENIKDKIENVKASLSKLTPSLNSNIEEKFITTIRPENKAVVDNLLEKIKQLSILQKLLLYHKLVSTKEDTDQVDPLRRPLNPLGNRSEVTQALAYIKTHFLPDPDISLPKKEIYNEYVSYCSVRKMKPLSTADFGKAMKQIYPVVRPRRLGERGNSRYCYSGLCNRDDLNKPRIPGFPVGQSRETISRNICCWASKMLNVQVDSLTHLNSIISTGAHPVESGLVGDSSVNNSQKEDQKRCADKKHKLKVENTETKQLRSAKQRKISKQKKSQPSKTNSTKSYKHSLDLLSIQSQGGQTQAAVPAAESDKSCDNKYQNQIRVQVDALKVNDSFTNHFDLKPEKSSNFQKKVKNISNRRLSHKQSHGSKKSGGSIAACSFEKEVCPEQIVPTEDSFSIVSIEEEPLLNNLCRETGNLSKAKPVEGVYFCSKPIFSYKKVSQPPDELTDKISVDIDNSAAHHCDQTDTLSDVDILRTGRFGHYLQDEGNSQEPEEELLKYFKDSAISDTKECNSFKDKDMSQLRLLLEQNLNEDTSANYNSTTSEQDISFRVDSTSETKHVDLKNCLITVPQRLQSVQKQSFPSILQGSNTRRRVSFDNNPDSFLQSPNIYRTNFSFTPISPRPPTVSKSNVSISPFVFPRETILRGKFSSSISSNLAQNPVQSPVLPIQGRVHVSPLKTISRSTSLSSTPSPSTNGCSSSSTLLRGRSTPQDTSQEHADSNKSSPLISPSSSSGVFLSPSSPISSCNSPVFSFRKSMSPVKHGDDTAKLLKSNSSLLQSLLLTGKCSDIKTNFVKNEKSYVMDESNQKHAESLELDLNEFSFNRSTSNYRSQSVPTLTNNVTISPTSNTLPFPLSLKCDSPPLLEIKEEELQVLDSVISGYKQTDYSDNLLMDNMSDNNTVESDIQNVENEVSMESVISNLCELLGDKGVQNPDLNMKPAYVSRSHPNTPLIYNEQSDIVRDPVVSAFPLASTSKSYPSTPIASTSQTESNVTTTNSCSAKRNIIPLLDSLTSSVPSLSDDIQLSLNNLAGLSSCDDAFNELAREVASSSDYKEMQ